MVCRRRNKWCADDHVAAWLLYQALLLPPVQRGRVIMTTSWVEKMARAIAWANNQAQQEFTFEEIVGTCRKAPLVNVRHHAQWYCRAHYFWSFPRIALYFGGRDHASIMHGVAKINAKFGFEKNYPTAERLAEARALVEKNIHEIAERFAAGMSFQDLQDKYHCSYDVLKNALIGAGYDHGQLLKASLLSRAAKHVEAAQCVGTVS